MAEGRIDIHLVMEHVPDDRLQLYLNACDFVVLNYSIPSSGVSALAMSFGCAVIAPDVDGLRQTLDGRGTIFFDHSDSHGLDDAFRQGMAKAAISVAMGEANRQRAATWSWEDAAHQIFGWYANS
jgi:glycosyltransferase involved in cell wall biosynthesis